MRAEQDLFAVCAERRAGACSHEPAHPLLTSAPRVCSEESSARSAATPRIGADPATESTEAAFSTVWTWHRLVTAQHQLRTREKTFMDNPGNGSPRAGMARLTTRRELLRRGLLGAGALAFGSSLLAACSSASAPAAAPTTAAAGVSTPGSAGGTVTVGSNYSDAVPKKAMQNVFDAFTKKTGIQVVVNTVQHE